jgi:hypothetical protein
MLKDIDELNRISDTVGMPKIKVEIKEMRATRERPGVP